jgi:hypothetical protein
MPSAYADIFNCSLLIYILLGTIFMLCITFCNAKLNNIGDTVSPSFRPVLFSKKGDYVSSILTAFLVVCTNVLHIFVNFVGILKCVFISSFWSSVFSNLSYCSFHISAFSFHCQFSFFFPLIALNVC